MTGRRGLSLAALAMTAVFLVPGSDANAATVATVPLGTATSYAVLGAVTVTNTGGSTLSGGLGLWPGTSITGFPPGQVLAPGLTDVTNGAAQQAQSDLSAAYLDAAGRPLDATTTADLANLTLTAGVYAGPSKSALSLTGPLTLDAAGDPSAVFIFQTDSTLITGSASTVTLINGAQECNVFWQVGSSATLGSNSVFTGNILALTSITVTNGVTVHGRALARTGAVTLDNDTFTTPTCAQTITTTTTTTTTTTVATTTAAPTTTAVPTTSAGDVASTSPSAAVDTTTTTAPGLGVPSGTLPPTGRNVGPTPMLAALALILGGVAVGLARRKTLSGATASQNTQSDS